jgi:hypothetical protein
MRKIFALVVLIALTHGGFAQTSFLKDAAAKLDRALIQKDSVTLKQLLHKNVTYGHSSGWVQTKQQVLDDFKNGKLTYSKIENEDSKWTVDKDWASLRTNTNVTVLVDGEKKDLKLHVLAVWWKTNKGWQLIARQSTKI